MCHIPELTGRAAELSSIQPPESSKPQPPESGAVKAQRFVFARRPHNATRIPVRRDLYSILDLICVSTTPHPRREMIIKHDELPSLPYRPPSGAPPSGSDMLKKVSLLIKTARGNADLLHDSLVNSESPRDLRSDIVQEFRSKCRTSLDVIHAQMPWVAAEARKRRGPNGAAASVYVKELQAVDGQLLSVLQLYDDLIRVGYNQQAQQRVKDEHTLRMLATSGMSGLSLDDASSRRNGSQQPESSTSTQRSELERLFVLSQTGLGNADLLRDLLVKAQPADVEGPLIQEFLKACKDSQNEIFEQIRWADVEAARSRQNSHCSTPTREEQLLESLLKTDNALTQALKMYDDLVRDGTVTAGELQASTSSAGSIHDPQSVAELCRNARGNAEVLQEALAHAMPSDLNGELIQEFYTNCQASQRQILDKVPWATTEAEGDLLGELLQAVEEVNKVLHQYDIIKAGKRPVQSHSIEHGPEAPQAQRSQTEHDAQRGSVKADFGSNLPPLTCQDRSKFSKIFLGNNPQNGALSGERVRDLLLKSRLPPATLSQIWDLADIQRRGVLDVGDFIVAMYLVQACMNRQLTSIPDFLPTEIYEQAHGQVHSGISDHSNGSPQLGRSRSASSPATSPIEGLVVPTETKAHADRIFDTLDAKSTGQAQGYVVVSFMLKLGLSMDVSNHIMVLADFDKKGYLTRNEFAKAMTLVDMNKAGEALPGASSASTLHHDVPPFASSSSSQRRRQIKSSLIDFDAPVDAPLAESSTSSSGAGAASSRLAIDTQSRPPETTGTSVPPSPFYVSPSRLTPEPSMTSSGSDHPGGWAINPVSKARFDKFFDTLDPWKRGYIEGAAAVPFFSKSQLPDNDMAAIWDLADINHDGKLTRDEFAVAMHLILKRTHGAEIPSTLPPSLVPPSLRSPPPSQSRSPRYESPPSNPPPSLEIAPRSETPPPPYEAVAGNIV